MCVFSSFTSSVVWVDSRQSSVSFVNPLLSLSLQMDNKDEEDDDADDDDDEDNGNEDNDDKEDDEEEVEEVEEGIDARCCISDSRPS